jgi:hypothetical protein
MVTLLRIAIAVASYSLLATQTSGQTLQSGQRALLAGRRTGFQRRLKNNKKIMQWQVGMQRDDGHAK